MGSIICRMTLDCVYHKVTIAAAILFSTCCGEMANLKKINVTSFGRH